MGVTVLEEKMTEKDEDTLTTAVEKLKQKRAVGIHKRLQL